MVKLIKLEKAARSMVPSCACEWSSIAQKMRSISISESETPEVSDCFESNQRSGMEE